MSEPTPLESVFFAALAKAPDQRAAYLNQACSGDNDLRRRVERMLTAQADASSFLETPPSAILREVNPTIDQPIAEKPGTQIGPYKLLQQIGEGGMGVVYMAEQTEPVQRKVALKLIKPGMDSRQVIARFEAERQALAMMDHVNIARVLDAGTTGANPKSDIRNPNLESVSDFDIRASSFPSSGGRPYFVMELVHGIPITKYCDDNRLTPRQRLELFVPVCQAIQHAHQKGIIHRDIKPSNVMVTLYDGQPVPKVIDFGVAKATEQKLTERTLFTQYGTMVGTLEYMSPEQAEMSALGVDTRSDIYSLGVLLYELLTGSTPLSQKTMKEAAYAEILRLIKEEEPPKPSTRLSDSHESLPSISAQRQTEPAKLTKLVRGELDWIVMKAIEKDRARRYETASAFAADLQHYLSDEPVVACPPSASYRLRKFARRNRVAMMSTGLVAVALVAGTVVSAWQAILATRARHDAETAQTEEAEQRAVADRRRIEADEQRKEAVSQRRKAEIARKEAVTNLQKAREAGREFFTRVSENRLLEEPGLQPLRKELLEAAVAYYEGLARGKSEDPQARADLIASRLRLVQVYYHTGSTNQKMAALQQAIELVEEFLLAHPDATLEHQQLAGFFHGGRGTGDNSQPLPDLNLALRVYQRATEQWEKLVERYPTTTGFRSDLSKFYDLLGGTQVKLGKQEDAQRTRKKVCAIREQVVLANPGVYEHVAELGYAYQSLAELLETSDPEAAEALYRQSITIQKDAPDVVTYQQFRARHSRKFSKFLVKRNRPDEAIPLLQESLGIYEKLVAKFSHVGELRANAEECRLELALVYQQQLPDFLLAAGRIEDAEKSRRQALAILELQATQFPQEAAHWFNLGNIYAELQHWDKAVDSHTRAIELKPDYWGAWQNRGWIHAMSGRWDQAIADETKALELKPDSGKAWHYRGWAHANLKQWEQAIADESKALELIPNFWWCWYRRAQAYSALKQWDLAISDFAQAIKLEGTVADVHLEKAAAHAHVHQPDQAIAEVKQAVAKGFRDASQLRNREDLATLREREDFKKLLAELEE